MKLGFMTWMGKQARRHHHKGATVTMKQAGDSAQGELFTDAKLNVVDAVSMFRDDPELAEFEDALERSRVDDVTWFDHRVQNSGGLGVVEAHIEILKREGIYERALLIAYACFSVYEPEFSFARLRRLLRLADRNRLRAAGDPVPGSGPFTLYRGLTVPEWKERPVRGLSWTADLDAACWFAMRAREPGSPAVFRGQFGIESVLAYYTRECEFLVAATTERVHRVRLSESEIVSRAAKWCVE